MRVGPGQGLVVSDRSRIFSAGLGLGLDWEKFCARPPLSWPSGRWSLPRRLWPLLQVQILQKGAGSFKLPAKEHVSKKPKAAKKPAAKKAKKPAAKKPAVV